MQKHKDCAAHHQSDRLDGIDQLPMIRFVQTQQILPSDGLHPSHIGQDLNYQCLHHQNSHPYICNDLSLIGFTRFMQRGFLSKMTLVFGSTPAALHSLNSDSVRILQHLT